MNLCSTFWGSHGCMLPAGHLGNHACSYETDESGEVLCMEAWEDANGTVWCKSPQREEILFSSRPFPEYEGSDFVWEGGWL